MESLQYQPTPYDNDVTLLYKFSAYNQLPIRLIIVRPRNPDLPNESARAGTQSLVFESLPNILLRLYEQGETPAEIYDIITHFNSTITYDDIAMAYYGTLIRDNENAKIQAQAPSLVNKFYKDMGDSSLDRFENKYDLDETYEKIWLNNIRNEQIPDLARLQTILLIQQDLAQVELEDTILLSPIIMTSSTKAFRPTLDGRSVTPNDGLDIFNQAVVSKYVPFLRYNDQYGKAFYRVYTGDKIETTPNYNVTIIPSNLSNNKNTIYLTLWLGDPNNDGSGNIYKAPRDSFFTMIYHLENNYLSIETPIDIEAKKNLVQDPLIAYDRAQKALPIIEFGEGREIKVRGEFDIWNFDFDETSFLDMILLESVMNVYLYVEENMKPYALKKRLDVHYRSIYTDISEGTTGTVDPYISNSASVSITMMPEKSQGVETVNIMNFNTNEIEEYQFPTGTPYVHINMTRGASEETVREFIRIYRILMQFYLNKRDQVIPIYYEYFPNLQLLGPLLEQKRRKSDIQNLVQMNIQGEQNEHKLKQLQKFAPDLFVDLYPRKCVRDKQPTIISQSDIKKWENKLLPSGEKRQVMPFPKDNPHWWFVCDSDKNPYPGVKRNKVLPNRDIYPYFPCCNPTDQMTPGVNSAYREYVENRTQPIPVGAKADKPITTNKILAPDRIGQLPRSIVNILKNNQTMTLYRYGVNHNTNSLLHCICNAVDDPYYLRQPDSSQKDHYISQLRSYIADHTDPGLLKQELYDYTDDEIIDLLRDETKFYDPSLVYRAVENIFNINIYVFTPGDNLSSGALELPRFKIFHSRPIRSYRPTVIIFKTWGSESNGLSYPQCELIIDLYERDETTTKEPIPIMKLFGAEMSEICHKTLEESLKTITWRTQFDQSLVAYSNIYYYIDHYDIFKVNSETVPISQFIDDHGKLRALTLRLKHAKEIKEITIMTLPSQPENLPITKDFKRIDAESVIKFFGPPVSITHNNDGYIDGFWFNILDIPNGEYIPIIPQIISSINDLPEGPPNPLLKNDINITGRLHKLRRTLNIITQLIRWLYELARATEPITVDSFVTKYMFQDEYQGDSADYYDLTNIPRKLPLLMTVPAAIDHMSQLAPTLFTQDKIVLYDEKFAQRIVDMLRAYSNLRFGMDPEIIEYIVGYYQLDSDFKSSPYSKVFITEKDLNAWLNSLKSSQNYNKYYNIHDTIEITTSFSSDPYLYKDTDGKIYIIQNVLGGNKEKVLSIATQWARTKINIGFDPQPLHEFVPHMIYGISQASTLIPIYDNTNGESRFVKILYYGTQSELKADIRAQENHNQLHKSGRYAAMLELL